MVFRSIASTLLNELGYNRDWIERQLAHGEQDEVRAAYNYAEYLPERRRMCRIGRIIWMDCVTQSGKEAEIRYERGCHDRTGCLYRYREKRE